MPDTMTQNAPLHTPKPKWLRVKLPTGKKHKQPRETGDHYKLNTIFPSGSCPTMGEYCGTVTST
ncbi:lipoyl synthase, partial [Ornithobacterium rhinotracheale]